MAVRRVLYSPLINLKICLEITLKHHLPLLCLATIIGYLPLSATAASYSFTTLNAPGAIYTYAFSINTSGQVAGYYGDVNGNHAYVESNGVFTTLNPSGADGAYAYAASINDNGQVVGYYHDATDKWDSFVATPTNATTPIPSAIWLVGSALAGLIGLGRRHVCTIS